MPLRGIKGTLSNFLSAGGHISAGIAKAFGATEDAISSYISRHIIGPTVGNIEYINKIADEGIAAANVNNSLPRDSQVHLGNIPIVPDQYGDDSEGKRITTALVFGETDDDPGKLIRLDFEDAYTRKDMEDVLQSILLEWQGDSPEAFTGGVPKEIEQEAIREIYTSRKF